MLINGTRILHMSVNVRYWNSHSNFIIFRYGDKTPKSLLARMFGILWITVGISLSGIFTASLITGMTKSLQDGTLIIEGKQVFLQIA